MHPVDAWFLQMPRWERRNFLRTTVTGIRRAYMLPADHLTQEQVTDILARIRAGFRSLWAIRNA